MARQYYQGIYEVVNKDKYVGTKSPRYLSSYEKVFFFSWADRTPDVLRWGAEIVVIPYFDKMRNKQRRYMIDIYMKYRTKEGQVRETLVEIKPFSQTQPPTKGKKKKGTTYNEEMATYITNQCKWQAATIYAKQKGMDFRIITEKSIFR